ncbi:hypothetical protein [Flavobacterium sp.]|jgi:hypothetical protein|uniref:hypothetical protein n=1 Tax=Flavobacterium sp. TaxID=239 RepID=UPI0037BF33DD
MRFTLLVITILLIFQFSYAQFDGPEPPPAIPCPGPQPPPPTGGPCEICNYLMEWNPYTCEYIEGQLYDECVETNCPPLVPVSSNISLLFVMAVSLGIFYSKKKLVCQTDF